MTALPAAFRAERPAPRAVIALVAAIVLAGVPSAVLSGVAVLVYLPYALVGALLAFRRPRNPIGWLLIGVGWAFLAGFEHIAGPAAALQNGSASLLAKVIAWQQGWSWFGAFAFFVMITVIFPSGHLPVGRWRMLGLAAIVAAWLGVALISFAPTVTAGATDVSEPITITNPVAEIVPGPLFIWLASLTVAGVALVLGTLAAGCGSMIVRVRRAPGLEPQQLRWLVAALSAVALSVMWSFAVQGLFGDEAPDLLLAPLILSFIAVPIAIGVAVLRYRLYEIDTIINRTVLYGAVTLTVLAVFGIGNIGLQRVLEPWTGGRSAILAGFVGLAGRPRRVAAVCTR